MLIGYARVSTQDQSLNRQTDQLIKAGVDKRCIYREKISGTRRDRPELNRMIDELQEGDTVIVCELSRISRSTKDMLDIVDKITEKGAGIRSLSEAWLDTSSDNPASKLILTVFAGLVQFERDQTSARVKDGLEAARRRGHVGGRPNKRNRKADVVLALYRSKMKITEIAKETGLSRTTVYRILRDSQD